MKPTKFDLILYATDVETVIMRQNTPEKLPLKPKESWVFQLLAKPCSCKLPRSR